jgi:signal transduction histidine kinase
VPVSSRCPTPERADASSLAAGFTDDARFAAWLQRTRESERASLARELHDELGAILTAARLDVAWLAAQPASHVPQVAERLVALQRVLTQGIELKRRIVDDLHPTVLTHLGLVPALEQLLAAHRTRFRGRVSASLDPAVAPASEPALAFYRIVQESLTNIHKYARADFVRVSLRRVRGRIELSIDDDGVGFDPAAVGHGHHGLAGMRHRMLAVGGQLDVAASPGTGTSIRASVPTVTRPRAVASRPPPDRAVTDVVSADVGRPPPRQAPRGGMSNPHP